MNRVVFEGIIDGIVADRIIRDDEFSMPSIHFHSEYELYYLYDGMRNYLIEGKLYALKKGSLVLINAGQFHKTSKYEDAPHDRMLLEIAPEPFSRFFSSIFGKDLESFFTEHGGIVDLDESGRQYVERKFSEMMDEFTEKQKYYTTTIMLLITEILMYVARHKTSWDRDRNLLMDANVKDAEIRLITNYIRANYNSLKSLDEICRRFYISKSYLCKIFKEVTGTTVQEYIHMCCIREAQKMLESSDVSIAEIASVLGYGTVTSFERMFRKYSETTPLKYRKKMRLINMKVRDRRFEADLLR